MIYTQKKIYEKKANIGFHEYRVGLVKLSGYFNQFFPGEIGKNLVRLNNTTLNRENPRKLGKTYVHIL